MARALFRRLVAVVFALGGVAHLSGVVLMPWGWELYGSGYPWWRGLVMAVVDVGVATIALCRPAWLIVALSGFLIEQLIVNGWGVEQGLVLVAIVVELFARRPPRSPAL